VSGYRTFARIGKILHLEGLISATAGNLSTCETGIITITATGSMLGDLRPEDIVRVPLDDRKFFYQHSIRPKDPSVEIVVHREIYRKTSKKAIVHAHTPVALALAYGQDNIVFDDDEGRYYLPELPVIEAAETIASEEVAGILPGFLERYNAVVVRGHGSFAAADSLEKACSLVSTIEFSSRILLARKQFERSE
jgi:L-fuculose-phosphate aldolase